jgi:hydroxymethylbilane synthase
MPSESCSVWRKKTPVKRTRIKRLRIGTRGSTLALWQAGWVKARIEEAFPGLDVEMVIIKTSGDMILDVPLAKIGGKGLFVKEIENALRAGHIDLAVHSMKDVPIVIPAGLAISCVTKREDPFDVLISRRGQSLRNLPPGAKIGTSSLRRQAQLLHYRPDFVVVPLRGNLDTRIRKLKEQDLDAIVLASAGMRRMGLIDRVTETIPIEISEKAGGGMPGSYRCVRSTERRQPRHRRYGGLSGWEEDRPSTQVGQT